MYTSYMSHMIPLTLT